ncbi:hypothetical protein K0M31_012000 [Melipona bicolor]|uniref:Uncharacterized protein n=1 Tax=Melipona bicolor TaxID=60889 RepID=A0AA40GAM1_9HYME|nr:hypothetical protein K0M31_012000 [Melipona bicolor]
MDLNKENVLRLSRNFSWRSLVLHIPCLCFYYGILSGICLMRVFSITFPAPVQQRSSHPVNRMHLCSSGHSPCRREKDPNRHG